MIFDNNLLNLILLLILFKSFYDYNNNEKIKTKKNNYIELFDFSINKTALIDTEITNIKDMLKLDDYRIIYELKGQEVIEDKKVIKESYKFPLFSSEPVSWKLMIPKNIEPLIVYTNQEYYEKNYKN